jgi:accessory gene regulator B
MITRASRGVSSFLIKQGIIPDEDRDVYDYSFEILFSTAFNLLAVAIIAILSRAVLYTALFLTGFLPLRLVAGGYHAKNHFRCFLIMVMVHLTFLTSLFLYPVDYMVITVILCVLLSILLVFILAPSEDRNKPLSRADAFRLKKRSHIVAIGCSALTGILLITLSDIRLAYSVVMGFFAVSVSLLANYIKEQMARKLE